MDSMEGKRDSTIWGLSSPQSGSYEMEKVQGDQAGGRERVDVRISALNVLC